MTEHTVSPYTPNEARVAGQLEHSLEAIHQMEQVLNPKDPESWAILPFDSVEDAIDPLPSVAKVGHRVLEATKKIAYWRYQDMQDMGLGQVAKDIVGLPRQAQIFPGEVEVGSGDRVIEAGPPPYP